MTMREKEGDNDEQTEEAEEEDWWHMHIVPWTWLEGGGITRIS